uniref:Uncharacterized protein n=1 Tax=Arundo donax TaxID=35708 RepID=A0A0A9EZH7_ARUDO
MVHSHIYIISEVGGIPTTNHSNVSQNVFLNCCYPCHLSQSGLAHHQSHPRVQAHLDPEMFSLHFHFLC